MITLLVIMQYSIIRKINMLSKDVWALTLKSRIIYIIISLTLGILGFLLWAKNSPVHALVNQTTIIPYLDTGYKYQVVPFGGGLGFEQPGFDDSFFSLGNAAFGSGGGCPLDSTVKTLWLLNTDILLRRSFNLPIGVTNVKISVAIDNDVQVFINGQGVSGGFMLHEGCATRDSFIFAVSDNILNLGGSNLLAVRGRDRGGISYLDVQVTADVPTVIKTTIDIKPGSDPNTINLKDKGVITVAILSTATFDATTVDPLSVRFGPGGASEAHNKGHIEDVDGDGDLDLVLHFATQNTGIQCRDTSASLTGKTFSNHAIEGFDLINTVGCALFGGCTQTLVETTLEENTRTVAGNNLTAINLKFKVVTDWVNDTDGRQTLHADLFISFPVTFQAEVGGVTGAHTVTVTFKKSDTKKVEAHTSGTWTTDFGFNLADLRNAARGILRSPSKEDRVLNPTLFDPVTGAPIYTDARDITIDSGTATPWAITVGWGCGQPDSQKGYTLEWGPADQANQTGTLTARQ